MRLHLIAGRIWIEFHDDVETALRTGGGYAPIRAFGAKMAEHAGRLAAVLEVYGDPGAMEVSADSMACGIALAQHHAAELLRLQGTAAITPDLRLAARLLVWWQARPDPRCSLSGIYQRSLNALGDAATARRIVTILEGHGWILPLPAGTEIDGAPRCLDAGSVTALAFDPWAVLAKLRGEAAAPPNPTNLPNRAMAKTVG